jgi:ankyrin repeat protein
MAERARPAATLGCLAAGLALALLPAWVDARWAALGLLLAQPPLLLAWSGWRGRARGEPPTSWPTDLLGLLALWGSAFALMAMVLAWPLLALQETGALVPALLLSLCAGFVLIGLWRMWPAFAQAERVALSFPALVALAARSGPRPSATGLLLAIGVFALLGSVFVLAWPGLLPASWWQLALLAFPLWSLAVHAGLHRLAARAQAPAQPAVDASTGPHVPEAPALAPQDADAALYAALRSGRVDAALAALAAGANAHALPEAGERDQRTPPMLAALQGDLRALRQLIARGVDLNQAHAGLTPLLAATRDSWHGRPEAVMTLLANGADARATDNEGNTPLHHAARSTDPAVAALLLDAGAHVDAINGEGESPLAIACGSGNWRLARFLIEHGARPEPANGEPALLAAVSGDDDPGGAQLLLRHKARVDARGAQQRTALMQACASGNVDIVGVLLEAGADRNAHDGNGLTPLLEAARNGHAPVVARLAATKPNARAVDAQQRNALMLACLGGGSPELLQALLELGVDPQQADLDGRRAVDIAIAHGRWPQVAVLDPDYALPATVAEGLAEGQLLRSPRDLLREALSAGRLPEAEALLALGVGGSEALSELLPDFAADEQLPAFEWLLRQGASAAFRDGLRDSVLFQLLDAGGQRHLALQRLLERGEPVGGQGGLARFLAACQKSERTSRGAEQLALALLERGADAFGVAPGKEAPLLLAIRLGWQRLLEALLAQGADPNQRDARGHGAIHVAATLGREAPLRVLIRAGALPHARAPDGQTALGAVLAAGRHDLSHWLEWRTWPLPGRPLQPMDLPAAAIAGDLDAVTRLLQLGLPVDAPDAQGCTALLRAAGGGHAEIVRKLLEVGADRGLSARTGATPLSAAISMRHAAVVEQLLRAGADPDQALPGGVTPLMLATALGLPDIAGRLLQQGADVERVDESGLSALHCAALHAFTARDRTRALALFDLLLPAELSADATTHAGHTPLLLLLGARAEAGAACDQDVLLAVLERLFNEGVALDAQDQRGLCALHLAAMHGLGAVVQRLLREGANRGLRDALGRTPHDLALLRGYIDIAAEFEPVRSSAPSLARFLREPR